MSSLKIYDVPRIVCHGVQEKINQFIYILIRVFIRSILIIFLDLRPESTRIGGLFHSISHVLINKELQKQER